MFGVLLFHTRNIPTDLTALHNWNMTGHPQLSRHDNRTQLTLTIQNSLGAFVALSKPQVVEPELAANRTCVPIASYDADTSAADSWLSSIDAKGLLSKSVLTTTGVWTSLGYRGCDLGITATDTIVITVTSTPKYTWSRPPCATDADGCGRCIIIAESVQLFYWPSTSADNPKSEPLATTSGNVTAVYVGTTFTSPSVYLSYQNVWTSKEFCQNTGRNYSDALLTLDPRSLSSITAYHRRAQVAFSTTIAMLVAFEVPVNYTDLNKPASTSTSMAERPFNLSGTANYCQKADQKPILVVPPEIRNLDPDWKDCDVWGWGAHDPPRALTPVDALSGPISTIHPTVSSPAAASIPAPPPPSATSRSKQAPAITIESTSADTTRAFKTSVADPPSSVSKSQDPSVIDPASPQPAPKVIPTLDREVLTGNAKGDLSISSNTLSSIGPAMTSSNQVISINAKGVLVGGTTVADTKIQTFEPASRIVAPIIFESMTFSAHPSDYVVSGQTLHPGGGITISGTPIRLAPLATALIVGTHTTALATAAALPTLTIGSQTLTADRLSHYSINGQLLTPDGAITVVGTPISLTSSPALVIGIHTIPLSPATALSVLTVGFQPFSPDPTGAYSIGGQKLTAGGAITVSGTPISLAPSATALVISSNTTPLVLAATLPALTIGSQVVSPDPTGVYLVSGQRLTAGGDITLSGMSISLAPSATALIVDSLTTSLTSATAFPALVVGSKTFSDDSSGGYQIEGQTLTPGGVITVSETPISLDSSTTALVIGSSTETLNPSSTAAGLGALIMSALGNEGSIATTSKNTMSGNASHGGVLFAGGSERRCNVSWSALVSMSLSSAIYIVSMIN